MTLRIAPGRPGANLAEVRLADAAGQPVPDVQRVTLRFTYLDQELGSGNLVLQPRDDGSYGAVTSNLSTEGSWQIETLIRQRGRDDVRVGFRTQVSSPQTSGQPPSLGAVALPAYSPRQWISIGLAATGLALTFWISRTRNVRRHERMALYAASFAVAMIGGVLYAQYQLYINPETVSGIGISLQMVFGVIAGGMFVMLGPTVGAVFLLALSESLRLLIGNEILGVDITIYGLLLILFIIYMPKGILGAILARFDGAR